MTRKYVLDYKNFMNISIKSAILTKFGDLRKHTFFLVMTIIFQEQYRE